VRATGNVLELHSLHWADEVRDPRQELPNLPERTQVASEHLKAAKQLIDAMSIDWRPEDYRDTYEDRVRELVDAKRAGQDIVTAAEAPESTNVIDLMEALRRSLGRAQGGEQTNASAESDTEAAKEPAPRRGRAQARQSKVTATKHRAHQPEDLDALNKAELYERATALAVPGRSKMTREQLQAAIAKARRPKAVA
jgi:DNA end-binding protein Ku